MAKITLSVPQDVAAGFKDYCEANGYSQSGFFRKLIRGVVKGGEASESQR
jgi:hypothetical protein